MNKNSWIVIGVVIALLVAVSIVFYYHYFKISPLSVVRHIFKVKEIYPTKPGGREWFINMDSPQSDRIFDPGSHITKQSDGSWQISGSFFQVRMVVGNPEGEKRWKNVEVTGYAKVLSADSSTDHLDWYARGGIHIRKDPCIGLAIKGTISIDGEASWIKEIWHKGGYIKPNDVHKVADSILGRWIGWKVIIYNINNNTVVKMELGNNDNNHWRKVSDIIDNGGWYARSSDEEFYSAGCGKPKDYVILDSGPLVTFRSDNIGMGLCRS